MASLLCPPAFQMCEPLHACVVSPSASSNRPTRVLMRAQGPGTLPVSPHPWCVAKRADAAFAPVY